MKKVGQYIANHHQWIIATLIALLALASAYVVIFLQQDLQNKHTQNFYFASSYTGTDADAEKLPTIECWSSSLASNRPDAYRCMYGNDIYDPCFNDPNNPNLLACPVSPNGNNLFFQESKNKDFQDYNNEATSSDSDNQPWYIKLTDGTECYYDTGGTNVVAGMRYDYDCGEKSKITALLLPLKQQPGDNYTNIGCLENGTIASCDIDEAWY